MAYKNRFNVLDYQISQIASISQQPGTDPIVLSALSGIVAVEAVTAYELAIKDIFQEFARNKNSVFGTFVESTYLKLNGRIQYQNIKQDLVKPYGDKYHKKFVDRVNSKSKMIMAKDRVDLIQTYDSLILSRHSFVHSAMFNLTLAEAIHYYSIGKAIIEALDESMKR